MKGEAVKERNVANNKNENKVGNFLSNIMFKRKRRS